MNRSRTAHVMLVSILASMTLAGCIMRANQQYSVDIQLPGYADVYVNQRPTFQMANLYVAGCHRNTHCAANVLVNIPFEGMGAAEWQHLWGPMRQDSVNQLNEIAYWAQWSPIDCFWFNWFLLTGTANVDVGWRPDEDRRCREGEFM